MSDNVSPAKKFLASLGAFVTDPLRRTAIDKHNTQLGRPEPVKAPGDPEGFRTAVNLDHKEVGGTGADPLPTQVSHGRRGGVGSGSRQTIMTLLRRAAQLFGGRDISSWNDLLEMTDEEIWEEAARAFGSRDNVRAMINQLPTRSKGENVRVDDIHPSLIRRYYTDKKEIANPVVDDSGNPAGGYGGARTHYDSRQKLKEARQKLKEPRQKLKEPVKEPVKGGKETGSADEERTKQVEQFSVGRLDTDNVCSILPETSTKKSFGLQKSFSYACKSATREALTKLGIPESAHEVANQLTAKALITDRLTISRDSERDGEYGGEPSYGLKMRVNVPDSWKSNGATVYDPELASSTSGRVVPKEQLPEGYHKELSEIIGSEKSPNVIARGLSSEELENILESGRIKSLGGGNTASQTNLTFFSTNYSIPAFYAGDGAPTAYTPTVEKPGYILFLNRPEGARDSTNDDRVDGSSVALEGEVEISADDIQRIVEVRPIAHTESWDVSLAKDYFSYVPNAYSFNFDGYNDSQFVYRDATAEFKGSDTSTVVTIDPLDEQILGEVTVESGAVEDLNGRSLSPETRQRMVSIKNEVEELIASPELALNNEVAKEIIGESSSDWVLSSGPLWELNMLVSNLDSLHSAWGGRQALSTAQSLSRRLARVTEKYENLTDEDYAALEPRGVDKDLIEEIKYNNREITDALDNVRSQLNDFDWPETMRDKVYETIERVALSHPPITEDFSGDIYRKAGRTIDPEMVGGGQENGEAVSGGAISGTMPVLTVRDEDGNVKVRYIEKKVVGQAGLSEAAGISLAEEFAISHLTPQYTPIEDEDFDPYVMSHYDTNDAVAIELVPGKPLGNHHDLTNDYKTIAISRYAYYQSLGYSATEASRMAMLDIQRSAVLDTLLGTADRTNGGNILYDSVTGDVKYVDFGYILFGHEQGGIDLISMSDGTLGEDFPFESLLPEVVEYLENLSGSDIVNTIEKAMRDFSVDFIELEGGDSVGFGPILFYEDIASQIDELIEQILEMAKG